MMSGSEMAPKNSLQSYAVNVSQNTTGWAKKEVNEENCFGPLPLVNSWFQSS